MSKPILKLSSDLSLPLDAVTQTFAFLARRGSGKTYGASKLAEEMLEHDGQIVVLDPVGSWFGLRVGADGKSKGFPIPVLGGLHGDVPLEPSSGHLVADLIVDRGTSAVLDVSMMRKGDRKRFAAEFAEQFFDRKKAKKSPVHLFIEEAQVFVPQRVMPDEARMLGAFEDIIKLGRNFGIGATLISQRPQSVNKDALNQTECLVVLQTNGAQERKALRDWIVDQGMDVGELIDSLPGLQRGEAWVWSPSWLGITKRVNIGKKRTLNASATPEPGRVVESKPLAPIDLDQLRASMADVVAKAEAADPKKLQKRVAELERELATRKTPVAKVETKVIERQALKEGQLRRVEVLAERFTAMQTAIAEAVKPLVAGLVAVKSPAPPTQTRPVATATQRPAIARASVLTGDNGLGKGERAMLDALGLRHPSPLSREQLGALAGYSAGSGTFSTYVARLRSAGLISSDFPARLTDAGVAAATAAVNTAPQTTDDVIQLWRSKIGGGERKMFDVLLAARPKSISRDELGERSGYSPASGTFSTYLARLRSLSLIENDGRDLRVSDSLFVGGGS